MRIRKSVVAAAVGMGVLATLLPQSAWAGPEPEVTAVALSSGGTRLSRFDVERPSRLTPIGRITGLTGDDRLVGIDRRVQNGRLYGVGDEGGLYVLAGNRAVKVGQLSVALNGTSFGVDFNPAANALRVVSNRGQNLRQPFGSGRGPTGATVADSALNVMGAPVSGIAGAAYTNNDRSDATATTLFDIDTPNDQVVVQAPANSGSLSPTGTLGRSVGRDVGFDIFSGVEGGRAVVNFGFVAIPSATTSRFYEVDLLTGEAIYIGRFPSRVSDIAIALDR